MTKNTEATVTVGNFRQGTTTTLTPGKVGEAITIKTDSHEYRIKIEADGGLNIMSEHFINTRLSVLPVVTNVIVVKGVES